MTGQAWCGTLRVTPAMAAKVTDRLWDVVDIVKVLEDWEARDNADAGEGESLSDLERLLGDAESYESHARAPEQRGKIIR